VNLPLRSTAALLCIATFVAGAMGFTTGMVICRDADGCVAVEVSHQSHQGCHSEDDSHPEQRHQEEGQEEDSCSDTGLAAHRSERVTGFDASHFFAMNFIASAHGRGGCTLYCPALLRPSVAFDAQAGIPRAEAVGLRAIILLV
jgi:hypothetical protein